jgi:hypothetical protein
VKRSALGSRTAPLARGKALARTALPRGTSVLRRSPLPSAGAPDTGKPLRVSRNGGAPAAGPSAKTRRLVYARAGKSGEWPGGCEYPGCTRARTELHHRLNRKDGGRHGAACVRINGAAWLLAVCRVHHRLVTSACGAVLAQARADGWVLMEHQDAAVTPVLTRHHDLPVLLDDVGDWTSRVD